MSTNIDRIKLDARTMCDEHRWTLIVHLEILLFNTPWWELKRQYRLRKLIRIYRKGL